MNNRFKPKPTAPKSELRGQTVSQWRVWREAARPKTLPAAIAPVLAASGLAWHTGGFDWRAATLCAAFALLMQIGANFANDYYDFLKGGDTAERRGPRRAVASGLISPAAMRAAMRAVFALGFALGLGLVAWGGWWLVGLGLVCVVCAVAYTGGPYPLAYHGWGDVFVFIFFGPVAVGATYYVQTGEWTWGAGLLSVPLGLLAANILVLNNYRDVEEDRRAGKRTTVVRFGLHVARLQFGTAFGVSFALPMLAVFGGGASAWLLLPCVLLPEAWRQHARLEASHSASELITLLGAAGRFLGAYALLAAMGLAVSATAPVDDGQVDREALVRQHAPRVQTIDPRAALTVGNGRFAFTVDVTGLQTLATHYDENGGMPLETLARWASHDEPNLENGDTLADDAPAEVENDAARPISPPSQNSPAGLWLRRNPQLQPLGQLGFVDDRGRPLRAADFSEIEQILDLWTGEIVSRFRWKGFKVTVSTLGHPESDTVAVRIDSPALAEGRLRVALRFPRGHGLAANNAPATLDWTQPASHTTTRRDRGRLRADFVRQRDELTYYAAMRWSEGARLENSSGGHTTTDEHGDPHCFVLRPVPRENVLELVLEFSPVPLPHTLSDWWTTRATSARHWENFWKETQAVPQFSRSAAVTAQQNQEILLAYLEVLEGKTPEN